MKRSIIFLSIFALLVVFIYGDIISDFGDKEVTLNITEKCEIFNKTYTEERLVYYNEKLEICNSKNVLGVDGILCYLWQNYTVNKTVKICKDYAKVGNISMDYSMQGYNCKPDGEYIICDSCRDGNCDGICDPRGGETCARINKTGGIQYKNSAITWEEESGVIAVNLLKINDIEITITDIGLK